MPYFGSKLCVCVEHPVDDQVAPPAEPRNPFLEIERLPLTGEYPAIPALQGGVKGYNGNIKETLCRKAPPFRAESFTSFPFEDMIADIP